MFANKASSLAVAPNADGGSGGRSDADGGLFPQRHAWLWVALPAGATKVCADGDAALAAAVEMAGFALAEPGEADAALFTGGRGSHAVEHVRTPGAAGAVAVIVDRGLSRRSRAGAARRAVARVASALVALPSAIERRRLERALARPGSRVDSLPMSDRARSTYQLGGRLWRRGIVPVGAIVRALPEGERSFVETAAAQASSELGRPLAIVETTAVESGKVLARLRDDQGRGWFLRLAGGPSADYISESLRALAALTGTDSPPEVRERAIRPRADGWIGPARYSIEPIVSGEHPSRLSPELWDDCAEFLIGLRGLGSARSTAGPDWVRRRLRPDLSLLGRLLGGAQEAELERLERRLSAALSELPLGWEHGDFWAHNLITVEGRLRAVLDWDTASPESLPLLDLYDLISLPAGRRSHPQVGARLEATLLPLAGEGGDERIRSYCDAIGIGADPGVLEAAAAVYWASRAARAAREHPVRARRESWLEENVRGPLRLLGGQ